MTNLDSVLKSRDIALLTQLHVVKAMVFPVVMYGFGPYWRWMLKNWCFQTVVLEKTLESSFDCKEVKPVKPKLSQPRIFIGRTNAEAETPILWPPDPKSQPIGKDPDDGKDWRQEEMVGWHHQLNGHEFEQALGDGEGQGSLMCCSPWHHKESDTTEWLNNNNNSVYCCNSVKSIQVYALTV